LYVKKVPVLPELIQTPNGVGNKEKGVWHNNKGERI
jgi:hypothetical protein